MIVVAQDSVIAASIGQILSITVTRDGQAVSSYALSLRRESRWLDDRAVLDAAELGAGRLSASAPGRAVVSVSAGGSSDSVVVLFRPSRPLVVEWRLPDGLTHVGASDTVQLRGYDLEQVTAANLQVAGAPVTITSKDSANLRFTVPPAAVAACSGSAPALSVTFAGIDGAIPAGFTRARAGEIALAPAQSLRLTNAEAACVRFAPAGSGARYLLAYADTRLVTKALTGPETPWPAAMDVTVADHTAGPSALSAHDVTRPPLPAAAHVHTAHTMPANSASPDVIASVPMGCPFANSFLVFCRATPYAMGDVFTYYPAATMRPAGPARVIALRGNVALGVFRADSAMLAAVAIARADSALAHVAGRGVALFRHIFGLGTPSTTSDESAQLLVMLEQSGVSFASWWPDPGTGHGRWGRVVIGLGPNNAYTFPQSSAAWTLGIQAHEIFHTYQFRWRFERSQPWITVLGTGWGVEGGASFVALELLREFLGVPFLANTTLPATTSEGDPYFDFQLYGYEVRNLTNGYNDAANMLRDFVQRLVNAGVAFDDAMREVLAGAMEGWHGINDEGLAVGPGLTARMRQRLGAGWNPSDALLEWTMSQAADDLTNNPRFQNLTIRQPSPNTASNMIRPHGMVANGAALTVNRPAGNTGVWEIVDEIGGSFGAGGSVGGVPSSGIEWLILRIQ